MTPKTTKTIVGMPVDPKAFRAEVPTRSGGTIHGIAVPLGVTVPRAKTPDERPSVEVQVLHVEDRLSLDDRWSLEPAKPAEEKPEPPASAQAKDDDSIAPAGVPRSSLAKKLFVLALIGGAGAAAYVERAEIQVHAAPLVAKARAQFR